MKTNLFFTTFAVLFLLACTKTNTHEVKITGKVTNPMNDSVSFISEGTTYSAKIKPDGTFQIALSLDSSMYFNFKHGYEVTAMYIMPGDVISLSIDPLQYDESISYEGSPTSSFLAKKYLMAEESDFFGKVYYMSSSEEYKAFLAAYKANLLKELELIHDSTFIKSQVKEVDETINYYISRQDRLSAYSLEVRNYLFESNSVANQYNFYTAVDSLTNEEFNQMLKEYSSQMKGLLITVTDQDYVASTEKKIDNEVIWWSERKNWYDNMPKIGEPLIDFTYPNKNGNEISLASFMGKMVYVDVWATWCGPCIAEIPALQELEKDYHGKNIVFISVSVDEDKEAWLKMVEEKQLGGIQLWADGWSKITKDYAIFGIPRFLLFSADGKVISNDAPRPSNDEIRTLINSNLN